MVGLSFMEEHMRKLAGIEVFVAGPGDDFFIGGDGPSLIYGRHGNDILY